MRRSARVCKDDLRHTLSPDLGREPTVVDAPSRAAFGNGSNLLALAVEVQPRAPYVSRKPQLQAVNRNQRCIARIGVQALPAQDSAPEVTCQIENMCAVTLYQVRFIDSSLL